MAIKLINKTNTTGATGEFPYGNIRDNDGSNNGTPVSKAVYADFHQFFARLMAKATEADATFDFNNVAENAYDGFQYFEALGLAINGAWQNPSYSGAYTADPSNPIQYRLFGTKNVTVRGKLYDATPNSVSISETLFTLPTAFRSTKKQVFPCTNIADGVSCVIEVNTNGTVQLRGDLVTCTANDSVYLNFTFTLN